MLYGWGSDVSAISPGRKRAVRRRRVARLAGARLMAPHAVHPVGGTDRRSVVAVHAESGRRQERRRRRAPGGVGEPQHVGVRRSVRSLRDGRGRRLVVAVAVGAVHARRGGRGVPRREQVRARRNAEVRRADDRVIAPVVRVDLGRNVRLRPSRWRRGRRRPERVRRVALEADLVLARRRRRGHVSGLRRRGQRVRGGERQHRGVRGRLDAGDAGEDTREDLVGARRVEARRGAVRVVAVGAVDMPPRAGEVRRRQRAPRWRRGQSPRPRIRADVPKRLGEHRGDVLRGNGRVAMALVADGRLVARP